MDPVTDFIDSPFGIFVAVVQEPEQAVEKSQEVVYKGRLSRFDVRPHVEHAEYF